VARADKLHQQAEGGLLRLVADAAFANPFGRVRDDLDHQIAGCIGEVSASKLLALVLEKVRDHVAELKQKGAADLAQYRGETRQLHEILYLFDVFHAYMDKFDAHIDEQIRASGEPVAVDFATDVLRRLEELGFATARAERWFAIFFQLRRAYYFITRQLGGSSPSMNALRCQVWDSIFTRDPRLYEQFLWNRMDDFSTLILGETGTGKGNVASAIGRSGFIPFDRQRKRFASSFAANLIATNLAEFPESLLESELFGHRKGAFTGAIADREGVFGRCPEFGAIFIDEVGDIPVHVQIKLLRVLQERRYVPVGGQQSQRFAGRVLAATNRNLDELRRQKGFRDDFYYRLSAHVIQVPTLRQRIAEDGNELALLVAVAVRQIVGAEAVALADETLALIQACLPAHYPWLGNVRELEQAVRRIFLTGRYEGDLAAAPIASLEDQLRSGSLTADALLGRYCKELYKHLGTLEAVASRLDLDPRTVKKYLAS
jgi:DNA-binding NtrC family response regulator